MVSFSFARKAPVRERHPDIVIGRPPEIKRQKPPEEKKPLYKRILAYPLRHKRQSALLGGALAALAYGGYDFVTTSPRTVDAYGQKWERRTENIKGIAPWFRDGSVQDTQKPITITLDDGKPDSNQDATVNQTLNGEQILLKERSSLPSYAHNEFDALVDEAKVDDPNTRENESVVTPAEKDAILAVSRDPLFLTVAQYDDATKTWKLANYRSGLKEITGRSYSDYLRGDLGKLSIALNAKVLIEDMYDDEQDIREMNGSYIFGLHRDGKMLLPPSLDNATLTRLYPDEAKRRAMLMNLWFVQDSRPGSATGYQAKRQNLQNLQATYDAVMRAYNDPSFNVVGPRDKMSEHEWARLYAKQWLSDREHNGWANTVTAFRDIDRILSSDSEFGRRWDMIKFIMGYARSSNISGWSINLYHGDEGHMIDTLPITYKAFGIPVTHAMSAPSDGLNLKEFTVGGIPQDMIDELNLKLGHYGFVDLGDHSISLFSLREPMKLDGAKRLVYNSPITRFLYTNGLSDGVIWKD